MNEQQDNSTIDQPKEEMNYLFEKLNNYIQTTIELNKLKAASKVAGIGSNLLHSAVSVAFLLLVLLSLTMALGFLFGELLGKVYLGFFVVTGLYLLIALILYATRKSTKIKLTNKIIKQIFD